MKMFEVLAGYLKAWRPLIYIHGSDVEAIDAEIRDALREAGLNEVEEYNNAQGRVNFRSKNPCSAQGEADIHPSSCVDRLASYLNGFLVEESVSRVVVLKDVHAELSGSSVCACLKAIAWRLSNVEGYAVQVIVVSPIKVIPPDLEKFVTVIEMQPPTASEIRTILLEYGRKCGLPRLTDADVESLSMALRGLNRFEMVQVLNYVQACTGGDLSPKSAVHLILEEKKQVIQKSNLLEAVEVHYSEGMARIGGLNKLVGYLEKKAEIYRNLTEARKFGVGIPKGILLVGMPGCGKSLAAKECARLFKAPLVRLDVGRLLGRYVGESEENLRRALQQAEAAMPCVLWIDEIEKAFAGVGQDESGVTTRLFGQFLTWMQEKDGKDSTVYVVATANDISRIPPEFLRRGRFDEIFSVGFPSQDEQKAIFDIHLSRRKPEWRKLGIDLNALVSEMDQVGYSGADIESIVKTALEKAYRRYAKNRRENLSMQDLRDAIHDTPPMRETMTDKVKSLEEGLGKFHVLSANG